MLFCRGQGVRLTLTEPWIFLTEKFQKSNGCDTERENDQPSPEGSVGPWLYSSMDDKVQEKNITHIEI